MGLPPSCAAALPTSSRTPAQTTRAMFIALPSLHWAPGPQIHRNRFRRRAMWANSDWYESMDGKASGGTTREYNGGIMIAFLRASVLSLVCLTSLAASVSPSSAADYPNRPVRWLIGFSAGGPVDIVARIMSQWLSDRFGQQFVVENRTGSGGNIAAAAAISSLPDGYTLLFSGANNAISTSLYKKLPFDFVRDTLPVASFMQVPNMLVVSNAMPVKTVAELIDYCKANPGKVAYASSGNGTSVHMSAELFKAMTKCDMVHVPYRGWAIAFPDVISNKVQLIFDNLPSALEQARGGSVRALGV